MSNILIVIDMQNDFIDMALGTKEAVAIVDDVVNEILSDKYDFVYATMDTHGKNYMKTNEGKHLPVEHCIKPSKGWKINDKVAKALKKRKAVIVEKPTFGSQTLPDVIRENVSEDSQITLIGLCTDICVVTNALLLKTEYSQNEVNCVAKCCAGVTPESHEAALKTMSMCQINIL